MELSEIIALISNPDKSESQIKEAAVHLMAYVQSHPHIFKLHRINEDLRSDLIYNMYSNFRHICEVYDRKRCPFYPYLKKTVYQSIQEWKRTNMKRDAIEKSIINEYASYIEMYACEKRNIYSVDYTEYGIEEKSVELNYSNEDLLVLALKYNYYLSGKNMQKLAELLGLPLEKVTDYIMAVNKSLRIKRWKHEKNMNQLSESYMLKNRYLIELSRLSDSRLSQRERIFERYKNQKQKFINYQRKIGSYMVIPPNSAISHATGIPYRRVGRILKKMKNIAIGLYGY